MADVVQFDHDQLDGVSQRFTDQANEVRQTLKKLNQQIDVLRNGAWVGPNADKYYEIMDNNLLPAVQRLANALDKGGEVTKQVSKMLKDADEENAGLFPS